MRNTLLIIGSLITICSTVPYILDVLRHKTKPRIASWLIWTVLTFIGAAAAWAAGEYRTAIFTIVAGIGPLLVVILGVKKGDHVFNRFDVSCLAAAVVGLLLWFIFDSPLIAIIAAVTIDLIGALPTLKHGWLKPFEETWQAFAICVVGALFALASIEALSVAALAYPTYIVLINLLIAVVILARRRAVAS